MEFVGSSQREEEEDVRARRRISEIPHDKMWNELPKDVKEKILLGLPLSSVLTIQSVSRQFHEILCSAAFKKAKDGMSNEKCLLASNRFDGVSLVSTVDDMNICMPNELLRSEGFLGTDLVDAAGGLLLFAGIKGQGRLELILCNPLTKSWKRLPCIPKLGPVNSAFKAKLSVDSATDNYEIVAAWYSGSDDVFCCSYQSTKPCWKVSLGHNVGFAKDFIVSQNKVYHVTTPSLLWRHNLSTESVVEKVSPSLDFSGFRCTFRVDDSLFAKNLDRTWGNIFQTKRGVFFVRKYFGNLLVLKFDEANLKWVFLWTEKLTRSRTEVFCDKEDGILGLYVLGERDVNLYDITSGEREGKFSSPDLSFQLPFNGHETVMHLMKMSLSMCP